MIPATGTGSGSTLEPALGIRLVLGVARLGEADLAGWWSSQGLNPAVRFALAGFRRTGKVLGAELALLSAERRHRQLLPRASAVHLFSPHLPCLGWAQADLAEQKSAGPSSLLDELSAWSTVEEAVAALRAWVSSGTAGEDPARLAVLVGGYLAAAGEGRGLEAEDVDHGSVAM